jgi:multimeric flavodoxin WrbA
MKIIAILSSPSNNGNTSVLAREAIKGAKAQGASVEEINLIDYNIEFCRGCMLCMRTGKCSIKDDLEILRKKVYQADGIILASPTYGRIPNARMKNFIIDRLGMFTVYTSSLGGKYFLGFSTAGGIGTKKSCKRISL